MVIGVAANEELVPGKEQITGRTDPLISFGQGAQTNIAVGYFEPNNAFEAWFALMYTQRKA